jgi:hypothetical protein
MPRVRLFAEDRGHRAQRCRRHRLHAAEDLGGNITGDPAVSARERNSIDIWARGPSGNLVQKLYNPAIGWSGWIELGGTMAASPSAIAAAPDLIHVVARSATNAVTHWW